MDREKITLTGAPETMYDFRKTGVKGTTVAGVALRAKQLDDWTAEFLADQQDATVLHLACGLDTRVHRLDPPSSVRWFDVDYPRLSGHRPDPALPILAFPGPPP